MAVPFGYREATVMEEGLELELLCVVVVVLVVVLLEVVSVVDALTLVLPVVVDPVLLTALWLLVMLPVVVDVVVTAVLEVVALEACAKRPAPLASTNDAAPTMRIMITATTANEIPLDLRDRDSIRVIQLVTVNTEPNFPIGDCSEASLRVWAPR
jgi:hypothetical protein